MLFKFAFYLTLAVIITGIISAVDILFFARKRRAKGISKPFVLIEYARAFFPVLLLVLILRSFIVQPYRVPTGSLEPTVMPGDFIAVEQFAYGLRSPVFHVKFLDIGEPKRGQIVLFRWPKNPAIIFVKRVIGLPGDQVVYKNKVLYINGKEEKQKFLYNAYDVGAYGYQRLVHVKQEDLDGVKHKIYIHPAGGETEDYDITVPPGHYFMMGDNRDNSDDSRQWGFVSEKELIGKAFGIWMSWDPTHNKIRWDRIGKGL